MSDHDVIVAGAGVVGLLTAVTLARCGAHVVLVEPSRVGAGQSGHSHGYLHLGYAYGPEEPLLPALLGRARKHWQELLAQIRPVTANSTIAFFEPDATRRAERYWRDSGLAVCPRSTPGWLTGTPAACFASTEPTYNIGDILRGLWAQAAAAGVEVRPGTVESAEECGDGIRAGITEPDGGSVAVHARTAVLAAGAGTPGLLARSGLPAAVQVRKAFMLVLRGQLPAISALFPEREEHGLFLACRVGGDGRVTWLVSDFQSFDGGGRDSCQLAGWWARRALLTLGRLVAPEVLARVDAVSGYSATKSGLLPSSGTVAHNLGVALYDGRAVVASPSKLTLAPLAVQHAVRIVAARLGLRSDGARDPITPVTLDDSPAREAWETPMAVLDHPYLLGELPDIATLSRLCRQ
jgi:glycine/D-amino acid oxidase-like deaminating enzyme